MELREVFDNKLNNPHKSDAAFDGFIESCNNNLHTALQMIEESGYDHVNEILNLVLTTMFDKTTKKHSKLEYAFGCRNPKGGAGICVDDDTITKPWEPTEPIIPPKLLSITVIMGIFAIIYTSYNNIGYARC